MEQLHNVLKFFIKSCQVSTQDTNQLTQKCEQDYEQRTEKLPIIVYGNLLKIDEGYKQIIRRIVKKVYTYNSPPVLKDIYDSHTREKKVCGMPLNFKNENSKIVNDI